MKVVFGDVWEYPANYICIPTNGDVNKRGEAVMGRGVAKQAAERYPELALELGRRIQLAGNRPYQLGELGRFLTFPVKHHWREKASLDLIRASAEELARLATWPSERLKIFVLPRPGCGNGGLTWEQVEPVIRFLSDNVHIIDLKETS